MLKKYVDNSNSGEFSVNYKLFILVDSSKCRSKIRLTELLKRNNINLANVPRFLMKRVAMYSK